MIDSKEKLHQFIADNPKADHILLRIDRQTIVAVPLTFKPHWWSRTKPRRIDDVWRHILVLSKARDVTKEMQHALLFGFRP